jgi:transposase
MTQFSTHVGLDVHKNSISVAFVSRGSGEVKFLGRQPNDLTRLLRVLKPLGDPGSVQICYEAGPTGYGLCRKLRELGYECQVVAPAKTPKKVGERIKTDSRDAATWRSFSRPAT